MFPLYGLKKTLVFEVTILSVYVCASVCLCACVAFKALGEIRRQTEKLSMKFLASLAAASLLWVRGRRLDFLDSAPDVRSFRITLVQRQKEKGRRWNQ